jgi:hypothetical protein
VACGINPFDTGSSQQGSASEKSTSEQGASDTGVSCGTDEETGVRLCLGTTECKDVQLDPDAFPGCGLRTTHGSYDVECVCNASSLCPVGIASSCDEIEGLFAHKSLTDICNQAGDGMCTEVGRAGRTPSRSTPSTCDGVCAADCAGSPACMAACGC